MTSIRLVEKKITSHVLVVGLARSASKKLVIESGDYQLNTAALLKTLNQVGATGAPDEVIKIPFSNPELIVFTGLGDSTKSYTGEVLRRASGAAARALHGTPDAAFSLPYSSPRDLAAIAEGALLGSYIYTEFRSTTKSDVKPPLKNIELLSRSAGKTEVRSLVKRAEIIAEQVHRIRDFVNAPANHLNPEIFATKFKKLASAAGLKAEIFTDAQLKSQGFGGITSVGQGSASKPRLLHVTYVPKGGSKAKKPKRIALVGKGITFDTGGYALKPREGMVTMKCDMSGAATVIAAAIAIAQLKLPIEVHAWAALAENMVSDTATRPSDVITMYGGKTVEVLNPDAEGRLVLGDALVKAAEVGKKLGGLDGIVDVATLTGAQSIALGTRTAAVMTNNEKFQETFLNAVKLSGELFWPMPLPEELRASLDSPIADIANIGDRMGGMLVAGLFLKEFVDPQLPWLHLDIAGPAFNSGKEYGYTPEGGTGMSLASLVTLAEELLDS
ncbi:MAG: leucyl aminopeptidase [Actinobacteria bacterium]|nr:leucyl aminopeptidase [Actinomycetota bacterium]